MKVDAHSGKLFDFGPSNLGKFQGLVTAPTLQKIEEQQLRRDAMTNALNEAHQGCRICNGAGFRSRRQ